MFLGLNFQEISWSSMTALADTVMAYMNESSWTSSCMYGRLWKTWDIQNLARRFYCGDHPHGNLSYETCSSEVWRNNAAMQGLWPAFTSYPRREGAYVRRSRNLICVIKASTRNTTCNLDKKKSNSQIEYLQWFYYIYYNRIFKIRSLSIY